MRYSLHLKYALYSGTSSALLILTHVGAIVMYKLRSKPLVMAMLTGIQSKMAETGELYFVSQFRAITVFATAILVTVAIIVLA